MTQPKHAIVPRRIFLDTCTFQAIADCGGYVFGEDDFPQIADYRLGQCPQVLKRRDAQGLLESLKAIFWFDERAQFDWIVSRRSLKEVDEGSDRHRSSYIRDIIEHSSICLSENPPTSVAKDMAAYLAGPSCGFLSTKDKRLLLEAAAAECNVFLTIETRLPRISSTLLRNIPLLIATPESLWAILQPHVRGL